MNKVTIFGKEYPVLARYSAIRKFCDLKGIEYFQFAEYLADLGKNAQKGVSNKLINDLCLITKCFIERAGGEVSEDDIFDWIILPGNFKIVNDLIVEAQGVMTGKSEKKK